MLNSGLFYHIGVGGRRETRPIFLVWPLVEAARLVQLALRASGIFNRRIIERLFSCISASWLPAAQQNGFYWSLRFFKVYFLWHNSCSFLSFCTTPWINVRWKIHSSTHTFKRTCNIISIYIYKNIYSYQTHIWNVELFIQSSVTKLRFCLFVKCECDNFFLKDKGLNSLLYVTHLYIYIALFFIQTGLRRKRRIDTYHW